MAMSIGAEMLDDDLRSEIVTIPDFPIPGIQFKDITLLLANGKLFNRAIDELSRRVERLSFESIVAIEARGFVIGSAIASRLRTGLVLARKPGKLPGDYDAYDYTCEYRSGQLEVRAGTLRSGCGYLIVDDLLATGGTARATANFVAYNRGVVAGYCFLVEIAALRGRDNIDDAEIISLLSL